MIVGLEIPINNFLKRTGKKIIWSDIEKISIYEESKKCKTFLNIKFLTCKFTAKSLQPL